MAAPRSFRQTGLPASRVSPAPTMTVQAFYPGYTTQNCGSGLARDGSASVLQTDRVACIAGKPGSHNDRVSFLPWVHPLKLYGSASVIQTDRVACIAGKPGSHNDRASFLPWVHHPKLWERACPRWQRFGPSDRPGCLHRGQARLPQWPCKFFTLGTPPETVGAGLPAMAALRSFRQTGVPVSRASPAPTMAVQAFYPGYTTQNCGSGLARDGSSSVIQTDRGACIAGKPGSHNDRASFLPWVHHPKLWERACSRWQRLGHSDRPGCLHRGQARSHNGRVSFLPWVHPLKLWERACPRWQPHSHNF